MQQDDPSGQVLPSCFLPTVLPASFSLSFLFQAETRAEFAERTVAKLEKTIDGLEGESELKRRVRCLNPAPFEAQR